MRKIFEELIGTTAYSHDCSSFIEVVTKQQCLKLMQEVRIKTLDECKDICESFHLAVNATDTILNLDKNSIEL